MTIFNKPPISPIQQIQLLKDRGLIIQDEYRARCFLEAVSFFRLTPYMRPFQIDDDSHLFIANTQFRQLSRLYDFDRRLRLLVIDAIERTEVAIRAHLSNILGVKYGAHWYLDRNHFKRGYDHDRLINAIQKKQNDERYSFLRDCKQIDDIKTIDNTKKDELKLKRQKESYARHYSAKYSDPSLMPNWAMFEEMTLGDLSHFYKGLAKDADKKSIAQSLKLTAPLLESWLHTLTAVRNICAHHGRLWNKELGIKPAKPKQDELSWPLYLKVQQSQLTRASGILAMLHHFMQQTSPNTSWHIRLFELFNDFPEIHLSSMGLSNNWREDDFWKSTHGSL